jgi:DNA repair protein RecO (recombination protein O)
MPTVSDVAICLRRWDWSETSQTAVLLTREHGLVRVLAKGSRRTTGRSGQVFSGGIEPLTRARVSIVLKPVKELHLLTEWDLAEVFPALRAHLPVLHSALYGAELAQRLVHDQDPHPELFDALLAALRALTGPSAVPIVLLRLQMHMLTCAGFRPVLDRCALSGAPLPESAKTLSFAPDHGGLVKAPPAPGSREIRWAVRASTIRALLHVLHAEDQPGLATHHTEQDLQRANRLLGAYLAHLLGAQPHSAKVVFPGDDYPGRGRA